MGVKTVTVATCDGWTGREADLASACEEEVVAEVNGRVLCEDCTVQEVKELLRGKLEGPLEIGKFEPGVHASESSAAGGQVQEEKNGKCPECGGGPYKALSAHRRKYHGIFVRGAKAVREAPSPAIPFDRAEMAESVAEKIRREKAEDF